MFFKNLNLVIFNSELFRISKFRKNSTSNIKNHILTTSIELLLVIYVGGDIYGARKQQITTIKP